MENQTKNRQRSPKKKEINDKWGLYSGERLKRFRNTVNLSQNDLGKATGIATSVIANYEQGRTPFSYKNLIEGNKLFNSYIEDNNLPFQQDCFIKIMTGIMEPEEIMSKSKRYVPKGDKLVFFKESQDRNNLYDAYKKLSHTDQVKIRERIDFILSTYKDEESIPTKYIPLIGQTACGNPIEAIRVTDEYIETNELKANFALTAVGDSMAPLINDTDTILIKQTEDIEIGEIGIFQINQTGFADDEEVTCKLLKSIKDGVMTLVPLNPLYNPIFVDMKKENVRIIGKYLGKA